jgi:hypothetical protein
LYTSSVGDGSGVGDGDGDGNGLGDGDGDGLGDGAAQARVKKRVTNARTKKILPTSVGNRFFVID